MKAVDHGYMARALQLAERGIYSTDPNPRVGCVLVKEGVVIGEGWHQRAGEPHAEIHALRMAGDRAAGATAYVTLEPCNHHGRTPPCSEALVDAKVARVVVAMEDPNPRVAGSGLQRLREAGIVVAPGVMAAEAQALNAGFCKRMHTGLPWVRVKLAMSLDGRTAMASGESEWITGQEARRDVQRWRARSSAIVTGIGTVLADDPSLNVRLEADELNGVTPVRQPLRVVLDSGLRMPAKARMLALAGETLVLTGAVDPAAGQALRRAGAQVLKIPSAATGLHLDAVLRELADRECNEVLVETGPTLSGAFVAAGLVDELLIYMAPHLMGADARGLLQLPGLERMAQRVELEIQDIRAVGRDWRITARSCGAG